MGAIVQGISLGFQVAEQDNLVKHFKQDIATQKASIRKYYTDLYDAVQQLLATDPIEDSHTSFPTPAPTRAPTRKPTGIPTHAPSFTPGRGLMEPCREDPRRGDLYCMPFIKRCGMYGNAGDFCDDISLCDPSLKCVSQKCQ